ncbi:hypothetical protein D1C45_23960 [Salmonella enterica]|nr:hypothetical protein [Salmonella enterica]
MLKPLINQSNLQYSIPLKSLWNILCITSINIPEAMLGGIQLKNQHKNYIEKNAVLLYLNLLTNFQMLNNDYF